MSNIL